MLAQTVFFTARLLWLNIFVLYVNLHARRHADAFMGQTELGSYQCMQVCEP